jgi:hypothetical protein
LPGPLWVALTVYVAHQLGGGRFAQALAGVSVLVAPAFLGSDVILSMNAFEPLFWMGYIAVLIAIIKTANSRLWLWFGVLAGLGSRLMGAPRRHSREDVAQGRSRSGRGADCCAARHHGYPAPFARAVPGLHARAAPRARQD